MVKWVLPQAAQLLPEEAIISEVYTVPWNLTSSVFPKSKSNLVTENFNTDAGIYYYIFIIVYVEFCQSFLYIKMFSINT
jgi:hypothetical protein